MNACRSMNDINSGTIQMQALLTFAYTMQYHELRCMITDIPFEGQIDHVGNRMCGAASLAMVYRYFDVVCAQDEIWHNISMPDAYGTLYTRTYKMCQDALGRGMAAVILRAKKPVVILEIGENDAIPLVLNHRLNASSSLGHYTVFLGLSDDIVLYHDPQAKPRMQIPLDDLLALWCPTEGQCEITGNILIAISPGHKGKIRCQACGTVVPPSISCPACGRGIPLEPRSILGCMNASCARRTWESIFCPWCDNAYRD
jgi:hypothetical protein